MEFSLRYIGWILYISNCEVYIKTESCTQSHVDQFFVTALSFSFEAWHKVKISRVALEVKKRFQSYK